MSNSSELRTAIIDALKQCGTMDDFTVAAQNMLNTLGYRSDRTYNLDGTADDFVDAPPNRHAKKTKSEERFVKAVKSIHIIFQYTSHEIPAESDTQLSFGMVSAATFEGLNAKSFLFIAVELHSNTYARGQYAEYTREINKRFAMPVVVLFCTPADATADRSCALLTLAFVGRRPNKTDTERDVLQKVSLLRDINCATAHRGHVDILEQLSWTKRLQWIQDNKKPRNFDGLLAAWLDELDTEALNKRFYKELFAWFKYAQDTIILPKELHARRADWIIRLITRLLFIWFIKEKELVDRTLFIEKQVEPFLKGYDSQKGDSYYRAILQNLFFATLNTPITDRRFSRAKQADHRNPYLYRYKQEIADDRIQDLLDCFACTPFVNGGLFDSLDDFEATTSGGKRVDHFSDAHGQYVSVPNHLFFNDKGNKDDQGLITLFEHYKFTVEENTPIEQEVALDPELLGKVFENLLASYNQKTQKDVRKQTGSYYTPRPIVNYMVRQALVERLATITAPSSGDGIQWRERLHALLDYTDRPHDMTDAERDNIIAAIANIKIFDPAAGSGAFLMGVLHQLVQLLDKLDPHNTEWRELQKKRATTHAEGAFETEDQEERDKTLTDISDTFERYSPRFGRKLFLIQNSIFGADIQPVACQIAKLRFFISLTIEQTPDRTADNLGIRPLPNLETRFVVTDTLIPLSNNAKDKQMDIGEADAHTRDIKQQLTKNRERHFNATNRNKKRECRRHDKTLRRQLADALEEHGFGGDTAQKIAHWDPYDQNSAADWFNAEYMFGIRDGFDIVIGNPPYVKGEHLSVEYRTSLKKVFGWRGDLYTHFIFKGMEYTKTKGVFSYITNDSFVGFGSKARVRELFLRHQLLSLVKCPGETFDATIYAAVFMVKKDDATSTHKYTSGIIKYPTYSYYNSGFVEYKAVHITPGKQLLYATPMLSVYQRISLQHKKIKEYLSVLDTGIHSGNVREKIFFADNVNQKLPRLLQGRQIGRYYLNWCMPGAKYKFCNINYIPVNSPGISRGGAISRYNEYWNFCGDMNNHHQSERLLMRQTSDKIITAYHSEKISGRFYTDNTLFTVLPKSDKVNLKYAMAIFNSKLIDALYQFLVQESGKILAQVKINIVNDLPFTFAPKTTQLQIIKLINKITAAKEADPDADTTPQEKEIDQLVYQLYGLTKAEINIIEGA